jgi:hypothetical protein
LIQKEAQKSSALLDPTHNQSIKVWVGRLNHFLDRIIIQHNLPVMIIHWY